ncbi:uncharacterized protein [Palaemon carinicauda]|uniref:uncharacterized protein n=1 Tax=Palaemon carinicauda TaxID=392227 RepID=UPI0035B5F5F8
MEDLALTYNRNLFRDIKNIPSVLCNSDHRLVPVKLKLRKPKELQQILCCAKPFIEEDVNKQLGGLKNYSWQVKKKMKRFRKWMKTRHTEDKNNYNTARHEVERERVTYAIKDENGGNLLTEPRYIALRWRNHFENLLNPPGLDVEEFEVNYQVNGSEEPDVTIDELNNDLEKMKNGKAPGDDDIPAELLKILGVMTYLLNY